MKNKAFTLAETLIVISIIGILATVMLSVMSKMSPDKEKMMFKKAYQTVERTVGELVNDEELYPYNPDAIGFRNTESVTWPGTNDTYTGNTKFCKLFKRKLNATEITESGSMGCGYVTTTDGITYFPPSDNNGYVHHINYKGESVLNYYPIIIDINGASKSPNTGFTGANNASKPWEMKPTKDDDNRDRFIIYVRYDGGIEVTGTKETAYLKSSSTNKD